MLTISSSWCPHCDAVREPLGSREMYDLVEVEEEL
jgi:hypothetical protein